MCAAPTVEMSRRTVLVYLAAGLTIATAASSQKLNVLLLVADDMRPEIGCFGADDTKLKPITPNLDKLAKTSLVLRNNHVQQAVCGPTRASFMVGRRPDTLRTVTHTSPTYWRKRAGPFWSIPQMFREAGFYTASVGKVFDLRTSSANMTTGLCDGLYSWSELPTWCGTQLWASDAKINQRQSHMVFTDEQELNISDTVISNTAVAKLKNISKIGMPWFLAVGLHRPHLPFLVPQRTLDLYPPSEIQLPLREAPTNMPYAASECAGGGTVEPGRSSMELWEQYTYNTSTPDGWNGWDGEIGHPMPEPWAVELRRFYLAALSFADEKFGVVLSALTEAQMKSTVIAVVGDHGWHLGEQGMWAKCTDFDAATRAPMMIHAPGYTDGGAVTNSFSEHVDLMPTLAIAAGLPPVPICPPVSTNVLLCTEGMNILPLASNQTAVLRKASFTQWPHPFNSQTPAAMGYTMRTETMRYTEWVLMNYSENGTHIPNWSVRCARELYDFSKSSLESDNVADSQAYATTVAELSARLHAGWRVAAGDGPWPELPQTNQTSIPICPGAHPFPPPTPPKPPAPPTPCTPGIVTQGKSRHCSDPKAQANASDTSCWCVPAVIKIGMKNYNDCQNACRTDSVCKSWTFSLKAQACFRHSTTATYTSSSANDVWSGCE